MKKFAAFGLFALFVSASASAFTPSVWVYSHDKGDTNGAPYWQINVGQFNGPTSCSLSEPGAGDGFVRCADGQPTDKPLQAHSGSQSPVALLD